MVTAFSLQVTSSSASMRLCELRLSGCLTSTFWLLMMQMSLLCVILSICDWMFPIK